MTKLDELERLNGDSTAPPWNDKYDFGETDYGTLPDDVAIFEFYGNNEELICAARNALPALLRVARAAKAYRAAWIEANDGIESGYGPVPRLADELDAALAALEGGTK